MFTHYCLVQDPDGDVVHCRWAEGSSECSGVCMGFPHGNLSESEVRALISINIVTEC